MGPVMQRRMGVTSDGESDILRNEERSSRPSRMGSLGGWPIRGDDIRSSVCCRGGS